jgi:ATP-dependent helicase/nuclease subunit A
MLNLARFCINPADDYSLCCALHSPLFGLSDDQIFELCVGARGNAPSFGRVYARLLELHPEIHMQLSELIESKNTLPPYSFFNFVLSGGRREKIIASFGSQVIDPLEEFMTISLSYERTQPGYIDKFMEWFMTGNAQIKRDMETGAGVRIMTVHASKGLDSEIVFLIDTVSGEKAERGGKIAYIDGGYLWNKGVRSEKFDAAAADKKFDQMAEYYRLLYVAMTRARDRLYVYGFCKTKNEPETSWASRLWSVMQSHPDAEINENTIRIICPQTSSVPNSPLAGEFCKLASQHCNSPSKKLRHRCRYGNAQAFAKAGYRFRRRACAKNKIRFAVDEILFRRQPSGSAHRRFY